MKNLIGLLAIGILLSFTIPELETNNSSVTSKYIYTSKKCNYKVYRAEGGGTIQCHDWKNVGTVSPGNNVEITLQPGDNVIVRIMHGGADACKAAKLKREDHISVKANASKSSTTRRELYDNNCK